MDDDLLVIGISLLVVYVFAQLAYMLYARISYNRLRNAIIAKGRLISLVPVLTITTCAAGPSVIQTNQQTTVPAPGAPPTYAAETKAYPPPYAA